MASAAACARCSPSSLPHTRKARHETSEPKASTAWDGCDCGTGPGVDPADLHYREHSHPEPARTRFEVDRTKAASPLANTSAIDQFGQDFIRLSTWIPHGSYHRYSQILNR